MMGYQMVSLKAPKMDLHMADLKVLRTEYQMVSLLAQEMYCLVMVELMPLMDCWKETRMMGYQMAWLKAPKMELHEADLKVGRMVDWISMVSSLVELQASWMALRSMFHTAL